MRWLSIARLLHIRSLPFVTHSSFVDLLCRLISYIHEFRLRVPHAHTCARACVDGSVSTLLSPLQRQILHSWLLCRILPDLLGLNLNSVNHWKNLFHFNKQTNCLIKEK